MLLFLIHYNKQDFNAAHLNYIGGIGLYKLVFYVNIIEIILHHTNHRLSNKPSGEKVQNFRLKCNSRSRSIVASYGNLKATSKLYLVKVFNYFPSINIISHFAHNLHMFWDWKRQVSDMMHLLL